MPIDINELKSRLKREPQMGHMSREMAVDPASIDQEKMYAEFSVSSEFPVRRWFGYEILDHQTQSIRMGRLLDGASHRDGHYGDQIGIVNKAYLDEGQRKLRVGVQFSKNTARAKEIFADIIDGIRKNVSIDYDIYDLVLDREVEGVDYYRITDWEPIHTCNTPDGADPSVGFGRSKDAAEAQTFILNPNEDVAGQVEKFNRETGSGLKIIINDHKNRSKNNMPPELTEEQKRELEAQRAAAIERATKDAAEAETLRIRGLRMMAEDFQRNVPGVNMKEEAEKFIGQGKSEREFYQFYSEKLKDPKAVRTAEGYIDASDKEIASFSMSRAILALADNNVRDLGVEKEMSDTLKKKLNRETKGLLIPTNILDARAKQLRSQQRAAQQMAGTPATGGNTINENVISQSFIEYLTNNLVVTDAGVTLLPGMSGNVPFIRELDQNSFYWVGESVGPTPSGLTFSRETASPKLGGAKTSISKQMLLQSEYVSEAYSRRKIMNTCQMGIDKAVLYGLGSANQPLGVKNLTGTHGVVGADFNRDKAIGMKSSVRAANAEKGAVNFIANSTTVGTLQTKPIVPNYPLFLCDDNNKMIARQVLESNQVEDGDLFYGVWSTVLLLEWGFLDVSVNPYGAGWDAGDIEVRALAAVDTFFEYPQALSVAEGVQ